MAAAQTSSSKFQSLSVLFHIKFLTNAYLDKARAERYTAISGDYCGLAIDHQKDVCGAISPVMNRDRASRKCAISHHIRPC